MKAFTVQGFIGLAFVAQLALIGCTKTENNTIERLVPADANSFASQNSKSSLITLDKSSLDKLFIMTVSGRTSGGTPQWYDFKPQIVSFQKFDNRIGMFKENNGTVYSEIPSTHLLKAFDVVSEDSKTVTFSWGSGLNSIVTQNSMSIEGPLDPTEQNTDSSYPSIVLNESITKSVKANGNQVSVVQIAKVISQTSTVSGTGSISNASREETLALDVDIRSYEVSKTFKAKETDASRTVGFFVEKESVSEKSASVLDLIHKWDIEKGPIQVYISKNVPEDYKKSVAEGVLYWNLVFGREVVKVSEKDAEELSPIHGAIVIHWVPWLDAGAAYASAQADPLTGEVFRAQVFMPSAFTRVGSADILVTNKNVPVKSKLVKNGNLIACDMTSKRADLAALVANEPSSSHRLRLAQDGVRTTVAHEVGHALGLRHNFAASYSAKVSYAEVDKAAQSYFDTPTPAGLVTTTSVMDYVGGAVDILSGAYILKSALPYDKMAFDWAYSVDKEAFLDTKVSAYCSDEDIEVAENAKTTVYGCERFDAGKNPVLEKIEALKKNKDYYVPTLFVSILGRWLPGDQPGVEKDLKQTLKDSNQYGALDLKALMTIKTMVADVEKDGDSVGSWISVDQVKAGTLEDDGTLQEQILKDINESGSLLSFLKDMVGFDNSVVDMDFVGTQFENLKSKPYWNSGVTLSERAYSLNADQQKMIADYFEKYRASNAKTLIVKVLAMVPGEIGAGKDKTVSTYAEGVVKADEVTGWTELTKALIYTSKEETTFKAGVKEVKVPSFVLSGEQRKTATHFLSAKGMNSELLKDQAKVLLATQELRLDQVLSSIGSPLVFSKLSLEEKLKLPKVLKDASTVDQGGFEYLSAEVALWKEISSLK